MVKFFIETICLEDVVRQQMQQQEERQEIVEILIER
jgi:hypothetical protein